MDKIISEIVPPENALPGRATPLAMPELHFVNKRPMTLEVPAGKNVAMFAMGCFWGVERLFWSSEGVELTMVGYAGGTTPNPTYQEVCTGQTGHSEVVRIIFDPQIITYKQLLKLFWDNHDPTQGMRQGNDLGTQYRSGIYTFSPPQLDAAEESRDIYAKQLQCSGHGTITTEIMAAPEFYPAEDYHQQYLAKNPNGYCSLTTTGVACSIT